MLPERSKLAKPAEFVFGAERCQRDRRLTWYENPKFIINPYEQDFHSRGSSLIAPISA
jgi:hypothetical protein